MSSIGVLPLCCNVVQCVAVCCSALQCVAVRCSALQCVAVRCHVYTPDITTGCCLCVAACCGVFKILWASDELMGLSRLC